MKTFQEKQIENVSKLTNKWNTPEQVIKRGHHAKAPAKAFQLVESKKSGEEVFAVETWLLKKKGFPAENEWGGYAIIKGEIERETEKAIKLRLISGIHLISPSPHLSRTIWLPKSQILKVEEPLTNKQLLKRVSKR